MFCGCHEDRKEWECGTGHLLELWSSIQILTFQVKELSVNKVRFSHVDSMPDKLTQVYCLGKNAIFISRGSHLCGSQKHPLFLSFKNNLIMIS